MKLELVNAIYGPEGLEWCELDGAPYEKLLPEATSDDPHKIYSLGCVLTEIVYIDGKKYSGHHVKGDTDLLVYLYNLQAENNRLRQTKRKLDRRFRQL